MNIKEDYHVHSNYNDHSSSDLTVHNVIRHAEKIGLHVLAFTEHIRMTSGAWIARYLSEVESSITTTNVRVISGFEAKILVDGSIDCPHDYGKNYFLVASFHSKIGEKRTWIEALKTAIQNPDVDVLGHLAPEETFTLDKGELEELASLIVRNNKIVELNAKYRRPPQEWVQTFKKHGVSFHLGSDAHSLTDVGCFTSISHLISVVDKSVIKAK